MSETPLLDRAPPPAVAHGLSTVLLAGFAGAVLLSVVVPLPESVEAPFIVVTEGGGDPVVAPESGSVDLLAVAEGDRVEEGALLLTLRSPQAAERSAALLAARQASEGGALRAGHMEERLAARIQAAEAELAGHDGALASLSAMVAEADARAERAAARLAADQALFETGALSERDLDAARADRQAAAIARDELAAERTRTRAARAAAQETLVALRAEAAEERQALEEATEVGDTRLFLLEAAGASDDGLQALVAPCSGEVISLSVAAEGAWVTGGAAVAHVACAGQPLVAEISIPVARVGRVRADQPVRLRYDAFPHLRYGLHKSTVGWVAPAGLDGQFLARSAVPSDPFEIAGGSWPVRPGMTGSAEIVLARRPAITWAFEPLAALWDRWFG
ncbi:MAG: HlyD family efflux transporter periplasmic adaptor subunit [Alphaproteobacteria bacterium]|nr:HlyD family efflux transporter periplasmic adaptor subunit [Alphaproteobacteria bacterium]